MLPEMIALIPGACCGAHRRLRSACCNRKALPLGGRRKFFFAAFDEQGLEQPLESADGLAHGGLGHIVDLGRFGETFGFGQVTNKLSNFLFA